MGFLGQFIANEASGADKAPKEAARIQADSAREAIVEDRRQFDTSRADSMPWLEDGKKALGELNDPNAFTASPEYQFRRSEGQRDIGNSFASRGGAFSGNALRKLAEFNQNIASEEHGNWWNRTASRAGVGQTTAGQLGVLGANFAGRVGENIKDAGDARASGIVNTAANRLQGFQTGMRNAGQWFGYSRAGGYA